MCRPGRSTRSCGLSCPEQRDERHPTSADDGVHGDGVTFPQPGFTVPSDQARRGGGARQCREESEKVGLRSLGRGRDYQRVEESRIRGSSFVGELEFEVMTD